MIIKTYEINKVKNNSNFYLIYGKNEGLKNDCKKEILKISKGKIFNYDEKQVLEETEIFFESTLPNAHPNLSMKSGVIGGLPTSPRIPSVPKYFLFIGYDSEPFSTRFTAIHIEITSAVSLTS